MGKATMSGAGKSERAGIGRYRAALFCTLVGMCCFDRCPCRYICVVLLIENNKSSDQVANSACFVISHFQNKSSIRVNVKGPLAEQAAFVWLWLGC